MDKRSVLRSLFLLLGAGTAIAQLQFRPMNVDLAPEGRNSSATFTVSNPGQEPIAVRLRILTREIAEDGSERQNPVDRGTFGLFPASVVLEAGQSRAVRLSWLGAARPERELAYRILAEQVPVDFAAGAPGNDQVSIEILFRYLGAVYVKPADVAPKVVATVERTDAADRVNLVLENVGTEHVVIHNLRVTITGPDASGPAFRVDDEQLKGLSAANMLASLRRVQPITLPPDFPDGPLAAEIDFEIK